MNPLAAIKREERKLEKRRRRGNDANNEVPRSQTAAARAAYDEVQRASGPMSFHPTASTLISRVPETLPSQNSTCPVTAFIRTVEHFGNRDHGATGLSVAIA
jgi:hypothetical protein